VWADTGAPVPLPNVFVYGEFADGNPSPGLSLDGDTQGHFAAWFEPGNPEGRERWRDPKRRSALAKVHLEVSAPASNGRTSCDLDADALRSPGDIVVRLPRAPVTHFIALDE